MSMQDNLVELATIKRQIEMLNEEKAAIEVQLVAALERAGQKTTSSGDITGTLVKGSVMTIDEEKLKKALGAPMWKKVTKQVLDKERLEAHIVTGAVDANIVAAASTEKDRKPYIRVSGTVHVQPVPVTVPVVTTTDSAGKTKPSAKKRAVKKPVKK